MHHLSAADRHKGPHPCTGSTAAPKLVSQLHSYTPPSQTILTQSNMQPSLHQIKHRLMRGGVCKQTYMMNLGLTQMANFFVAEPLRFGQHMRICLPHRFLRVSNFIHLPES